MKAKLSSLVPASRFASILLLEVVTLAVVLLLVAPTAFAGSCQPGGGCLVTNGSFETGDFTGWTTGGNFGFTQVSSGPFYVYPGAEDGNFYATLGPVGSDGSLSQTLATTPGLQYCLSFWLDAVGDSPSDFSATWDGTPVYSVTNPNTGGAWTHFTFQVTGMTTGDTISFLFRDDPAYIALDNVSVCPGACSVPEVSNIAMLLGFGMFNLGAVLVLVVANLPKDYASFQAKAGVTAPAFAFDVHSCDGNNSVERTFKYR